MYIFIENIYGNWVDFVSILIMLDLLFATTATTAATTSATAAAGTVAAGQRSFELGESFGG